MDSRATSPITAPRPLCSRKPSSKQASTVFSPAQGNYPLPPWGGFAVLCGWVAVALAGAYVLLRRRDA